MSSSQCQEVPGTCHAGFRSKPYVRPWHLPPRTFGWRTWRWLWMRISRFPKGFGVWKSWCWFSMQSYHPKEVDRCAGLCQEWCFWWSSILCPPIYSHWSMQKWSTSVASKVHQHPAIRFHFFSGHAGVVEICTTSWWIFQSSKQQSVITTKTDIDEGSRETWRKIMSETPVNTSTTRSALRKGKRATLAKMRHCHFQTVSLSLVALPHPVWSWKKGM